MVLKLDFRIFRVLNDVYNRKLCTSFLIYKSCGPQLGEHKVVYLKKIKTVSLSLQGTFIRSSIRSLSEYEIQ